MNPEKTRAVVLKKVPHGEADYIVTFLTARGKRFTGFAPNAQKSKKRFGGNLDLFNYLEIVYCNGKNSDLAHIDSAELILGMDGLRKDLSKFASACYFTEMILSFLHEKDESLDLFSSFFLFLKNLNSPEPLPPELIPLMEHHFLDLFGFKPTLSHCIECHGAPEPALSYFFSGIRGGLICSNCLAEKRKNSEQTSYPLSYSAIELLLEGEMNPHKRGLSAWKPQEVSQARNAFEYFIQYTAGKPLKSLQFLTKILP